MPFIFTQESVKRMTNTPLPQLGDQRSKLMKQVRQRWQLYLFLLIPVIYILVFAYYPMLGVQIAFKNFQPRKGIWGSEWAGLVHFKAFFSSFYFSRTVTNTIRLSVYYLLVNFPLSIIFALMINIIVNKKLKHTLQTILYIPHFISTVVLVGMLMQILNPVTGLYGNIYRLFVPGEYPPDILSKAQPFTHLYVWSGIWQNLGWNTIVYIAALSGTDVELHEAAQIDGATRLQRIIHIDFPALLPTASIILILNSGSIMNVGFEKAYLMQNSINVVNSEVISTYVYKVGLSGATNQFSYAAAVGLFNNVINGILLLIVNSLSKKLSDGTRGLF
ncbi:MAG TPA: sugar ABC transporter permease [Clostridiales bacterium]|nr:sugar ABC transporter permease [Clostridiales bacterium]